MIAFHFFHTSDTCVSNVTLLILKNSPLRMIWLLLEKKLPPLAQARIFEKKNRFDIFSPETRFQTFVLYFFSYFRNLYLKIDSYHLKELYFAHILVVIRKSFTSYDTSMHFLKKYIFSFFDPNRNFRRNVFIFFCTSGTCFPTLILTNLKKSFLRTFCL